MALLRILTPDGFNDSLEAILDLDFKRPTIVSSSTTRVVATEPSDDHIVRLTLTGEDFNHVTHRLPDTGTVTGLRYDLDGAGLIRMTGLAFSAADMDGTDFPERAFEVPWLARGNAGADQIETYSRADTLYGFGGNDTLGGERGHDRISGGADQDRLLGNAGNDTLRGDAGHDTLFGGSGNDSMAGGLGNDVLWGGSGADRMHGNAGRDGLVGGSGDDRLSGQDGNDLLNGGTGRDVLSGGAGADRFVFTDAGESPSRALADRIVDFSHAEGDRIDLSDLSAGRLTFIGSAPFTGSDQVRVTGSGTNWAVWVSLDDQPGADAVISVVSATALVRGDFIL